MSDLLRRINGLISAGEVRISEHGYDELAEDEMTARELLAGVANAAIVEEYPDYPKGPCVLLLQRDRSDKPVHVVWASRKDMMNLLFWLRHTDRIRRDGMRVSYGGDDYDAA